jgi:topoisomerase IA-like protein
METKIENVIAAYRLFQDDLISETSFIETIRKIKGKINPNTIITANSNSNSITKGQKSYIYVLKQQGKLPADFNEDDLTKDEAQKLISEAVNREEQKKEKEEKEEEHETGINEEGLL